MLISGKIISEETPFFSSSPTVIIDIGVTSEPVPAVVGNKTKGNLGPFAFDTPHAFSNISHLNLSIKEDSLATSIDDPPPKPITPVVIKSFFQFQLLLKEF